LVLLVESSESVVGDQIYDEVGNEEFDEVENPEKKQYQKQDN